MNNCLVHVLACGKRAFESEDVMKWTLMLKLLNMQVHWPVVKTRKARMSSGEKVSIILYQSERKWMGAGFSAGA